MNDAVLMEPAKRGRQTDGDAQKLLHEAAAVASVYHFELVEPSLEEIFIQTVGGKADA